MIVEWGLDRLPAVLRTLGIERALLVTSERWRAISLPVAESYLGVRDEAAGVKRGGAGARVAGIVYEPELTLGLPRAETGGTALNALAHCAEALYVAGRNEAAAEEALAGAALISASLPLVLAHGQGRTARGQLLARLARALGVADAAGRADELARLAGFERLRDLGVRAEDLGAIAEAASARAGARANPRPASPADIAGLYRSIY